MAGTAIILQQIGHEVWLRCLGKSGHRAPSNLWTTTKKNKKNMTTTTRNHRSTMMKKKVRLKRKNKKWVLLTRTCCQLGDRRKTNRRRKKKEKPWLRESMNKAPDLHSLMAWTSSIWWLGRLNRELIRLELVNCQNCSKLSPISYSRRCLKHSQAFRKRSMKLGKFLEAKQQYWILKTHRWV